MMKFPIEALDGSVGKPKDALFDDRFWTLRYLVADTGNWLPGKKVLVSPLHLIQPSTDLSRHSFPVNLSKSQIERCPSLDEDAPVSRQYEIEYARYYNHGFYWAGSSAFGASPTPVYGSDVGVDRQSEDLKRHAEKIGEIEQCHLRSTNEVLGYQIDAKDDAFGHLEDIIMEDNIWKLRYAVVDSRNWLPGKKFLIDLDWIQDLDWSGKQVSVRLTRKQIESAPEFDPHAPINSDYLNHLYDYYGEPQPREKR